MVEQWAWVASRLIERLLGDTPASVHLTLAPESFSKKKSGIYKGGCLCLQNVDGLGNNCAFPQVLPTVLSPLSSVSKGYQISFNFFLFKIHLQISNCRWFLPLESLPSLSLAAL